MEALCKDAEEATKNIKTICDSLINENQSPLVKCGKRFADRLNKLSDDASEVFAKLTDVKMANWKLKKCLQINLCAIENTIREVWKETTQGNDGSQDEASTVVIDEEAEKELIALFREDLPYKQAKMAPRKLVDSLREVTTFKHKMVTARDFARCSAYFYTYRKGFLKSPYNKWKQFWEQIQKILNLKAPGYNNKCPQLTREYEQKYK